MRRRAILLLMAMGAALLSASGVAMAESFTCNLSPPCHGTPERDVIVGTTEVGTWADETIYGYAGNDHVDAGGGNDTVYGNSGTDVLNGQEGSDKLYGGEERDAIYLHVNDTPGSTDYGYGGGGDDSLYARDGNKDVINCGEGTDEVYYDASLDTVTASCETKYPTESKTSAESKTPAFLFLPLFTNVLEGAFSEIRSEGFSEIRHV